MTPKQIDLVQKSFQDVAPIADAAAEIFYARLFELDPRLRSLFRCDMKLQGQKLMSTLGVIVRNLRNLDTILAGVHSLALSHTEYGVRDTDYATVGRALIDTLRKGPGEAFTNEVHDAWVAAYTMLSETMITVSGRLRTA